MPFLAPRTGDPRFWDYPASRPCTCRSAGQLTNLFSGQIVLFDIVQTFSTFQSKLLNLLYTEALYMTVFGSISSKNVSRSIHSWTATMQGLDFDLRGLFCI